MIRVASRVSFALAGVLVLPACDSEPMDTEPAVSAPADSAEVRLPVLSDAETTGAKPIDDLYGHLKYEETDRPLADAGGYRGTGRVVQLRADAARAFREMQTAAREVGVELVPISGFRTKSYQEGLFSRAIGKYGDEQSAARWVAPPGYSEHHTGLALDIAARGHPETDVETTFESTPEFVWLKANAHRFGFELSFPRDNRQGVSYEPWHWRYVDSAP